MVKDKHPFRLLHAAVSRRSSEMRINLDPSVIIGVFNGACPGPKPV